ncbi:MAG: hypothetical protein IJT56_03980 [Clostridia bacterium]|nr:hypothetical protein [Clostridia bacterium]
MKRYLASIMLSALLLAGCGEAASAPYAPADDQSPGETAAVSETETTTARADSLPDGLDLGGVTITMLLREEKANEFYAEQTGDVMDTAVYDRDRAIEERFNCRIDYVLKPGLWASQNEFKGVIRSAVMAGDSAYDIVTGQSNIVQPLNIEGIFVNLLDSKYLDLEKPYWLDSYTEGINLAGKVETVAGSFGVSSFYYGNVIYFNKPMLTNLGEEYPYEDALGGKWTLDKFLTLSEKATRDINGDSAIDEQDIIGYYTYNNFVQPFFSSLGFEYTEKDADGRHVLMMPSEANITAADRINEFVHSDRCIVTAPTDHQEQDVVDAFMSDKCLFMGLGIDGAERLRDMQSDFGILPYPKYNEDQDRYYDTILRRYTVAAVPITAVSAENSAVILEALGSIGYTDIIPKYYEIALKGKYVRDDASAQVLDLIRDSLWIEFVDIYYNDLAFSDFFADYAVNGKTGTYASTYEKNSKQWTKKLEALYSAAEG